MSPISKPRALLFGGTSQIAALLIPELLAQEYELTVLTGRPWDAPRGVTHHLVELTTYDGSRTNDWHGQYDVSIFIPPLFLCKNALPWFTSEKAIFISSYNTRIFLDSPSYAKLRTVEAQVMDWNPKAIILQPTMITGRGDDQALCKLIKLVKSWPVLPLPGGGRAKRQPIHIQDLAESILYCVSQDTLFSGQYGVGGPDVVTGRDIVETIKSVSGRRTQIISLPSGALSLAAKVLRRQLTFEQINRSASDSHIDPKHALPGFTPMISFDQSVKMTCGAMQALENASVTP